MKDIDEIAWDYVEGCIRAFLRGKKTLNWILAIIRGSDKQRLQNIINSLDGDPIRKIELLRRI